MNIPWAFRKDVVEDTVIDIDPPKGPDYGTVKWLQHVSARGGNTKTAAGESLCHLWVLPVDTYKYQVGVSTRSTRKGKKKCSKKR
jgi:hypothetical protein